MKKLLFILACFPLAAFSQKVSQPAPPEPPGDSLLFEARELYSNSEYATVIKMLEAVSPNDTTYASALDLLALTYLSADSLDKTISVCNKGLTLKSEYKRHFYEMLGAAYDAKKEPAKAMETFHSGLKEFPKYTRFWYQMGLTSKAAKKYDDAMTYFRNYLRTNPYHAGSHLQMAILWYNSDKMLPTMLAYQMYLLLSEDADKSISVLKSYEDMSTGQYSVNEDSLWLRLPAGTDNFDELETIIKSKLALDPGYKTNIKLPYTKIVKTMQVIGEKLAYSKADTGFCMQFYVPFFLELVKKNQYQASIYYSFRSVNDAAVQKEVKKQDAATTKMASDANEYLNKYRQDQWMAMGLSNTQTWFGDNGNLTAEGKFDEVADSRQGDFVFYHWNSMVKSRGKYTAQGKGTGKWEYFYPEGGIEVIKIFKEDELTDSSVSYFRNGLVSEVLHYKNGKTSGEARGYYITGTLRAVIQFDNDVKNGKAVRYHPNGMKHYETTYINDEVNGKYTGYHDNGTVSEESSYKESSYDGPFRSYHSNGQLKAEGKYVNGNAEGEWKYYNEWGVLTDQGVFKAGNQEGKWKEFQGDGKLRAEYTYSGGKLTGESPYYDEDGKVWSTLTYNKNGQLSKYKYLDKNGKVLSEAATSGGILTLKSYYADGLPFKEGTYKNGDMEGKQTEWNSFGKIAFTRTYKQSELHGTETEFYNSGAKESETPYTDGTKDGLYTYYYKNGIISKHGWYKDGEPRGEWREYNADGTLSEVNYYQNGELQGINRLYDINGRIVSEVEYDEGEVSRYTGLDTTGKVLYSEELKAGTGKFNTLHFNKKVDAELNYKNGSFDGQIRRYYSNGKLRYMNTYRNGEKNGAFEKYDWQGNLTEKGYTRDGYRDSAYTKYDNGKVQMKANYFIGDIIGERTWYYPDGDPETTAGFIKGQLQGYVMYYADNKEVRFRLLYKNGMVQSYSYLGPDSNFVAEIPLPKSTGPVKPKFRNGTPSADFTFNCNWYEGDYTLYHPNGKVASSGKYIMHEQDGPYKEYLPNGTLIKEENYFYDELHGICKYYSAAGIPERVSNYRNGVMHGTTQLFDKTGKLIKTINFYNDEPY